MADKDELKDVEDLFNADDPGDMEDFMNMLDSIDIDNNPLVQEMEDSDTKDLEEQLAQSDAGAVQEKRTEEMKARPEGREEGFDGLTLEEQMEETARLNEMMSELGLGDISQPMPEPEPPQEETSFVAADESEVQEFAEGEEILIDMDAENLADESVGGLADILAGIEDESERQKKLEAAPPKKGFFQRLIGLFHREPSEEERLQMALDEEEVRAWEERKQEIARVKKQEDDQKKNAKKAEAERKKKEQSDKKAAAKADKDRKNAEKKREMAAKKAAKREAKLAAKGGPVPKSQLVPVKPMLAFVIIGIACSVLFVLFTNYQFYNSSVADSKEKFIHQQYKEAYETIAGLDIKEKDQKFYDQVRTVRIVGKELDAYNSYIKAEDYEMALKSLVKGVGKYGEQSEKAKKLNLEKELYAIYEELLKELTVRFGITAQEAVDLYESTDKEAYERAILKAAKEAAIRDGVEEPAGLTKAEQ